MSILITGGTGFIGAEVVRLLLKGGEKKLFVFHRRSDFSRLADIASRINFIQGNLSNFNHILNAVKVAKPKIIYHLGAMLSIPSEGDPSTSIHTNVMGTYHVLEAARLFDVPQVLFASSIGTYGLDMQGDVIDDYTLQRPRLLYGATKLFGEHLGLFYNKQYGLDFRGLRYPSVVGPGVKTPGGAQYTSWVIEECAKGNPFTIWVEPETRKPILYYKDAARATVQLAQADAQKIKMVNYLLAGVTPTPTVGELADLVRAKIPGAQIDYQPDPKWQSPSIPYDDGIARKEWGWKPKYDLEEMVDDFLQELRVNPERYS